ncbi:acyl-CoA reductase [Desulfosporosinus sp. FKB]|uniref:acyl-CoA reductase n=1 Tax=Desulfosporosinus sp. FKB TaxID=1969835 RepID=UPI000B49737E|nr:acyl-CoA reductase [Desulfosporosinus sp. FKB]
MEQHILAYFVPKGICIDIHEEHTFGEYILEFPNLSSAQVMELSTRLRLNRGKYLANLKTERIVEIIDKTIQLWLNPQYPLRKLAETLLPMITAYDAEIVRLELKRFLRGFRKKDLYRFLDEEFDNPGMLDNFRPRKSGGFTRVYGPELILHFFSGNVPGLPIWSMIMGLLLKSAGIGKTSSAEPLMAVLFAQSLAEVDENLAECLAVLPWKGGSAQFEDLLLERADAVVIYGSSQTVEKIKNKVRQPIPVLGYGHKISFAAVGQEALTADRYQDTVHRLANDVSVYDQQSCLSPQLVFVERGGVISPRQFAQLLASELDRYEKRRPRAKLGDAEIHAIRSLRNRYEAMAISNSEIDVYASGGGTEWTVVYHGRPGFEGSPLNRTIQVFACQCLEEALSHLRPYRSYLQSAGIAVAPERLEALAHCLAQEGVSRITAIGQMTLGVAGWHHDARFNLADLVRFVDIERSAEQLAELYDPDVE